MGKVPIKLIVDTVKTQGPKVGKFLMDNWKDVTKVVTVVGPAGKKINDFRKSKSSSKQDYRKDRFDHYKTQILSDLDKMKRSGLFQHRLQVEQYIKQIKDDENKDLIVKKPLHLKRINNWNEILRQIEDKMLIKDYQEYIMIYNNPNYKSVYFEGYEGRLEKFKNLIINQKIDKLYEFLISETKKDIEEIIRDFPME
jgi:hypothetical protein